MTRLHEYGPYLLGGLVLLGGVSLVIVLAVRYATGAGGEPRTSAPGTATAKPRERTFRLRQVSAFSLTGQVRGFAAGHRALCGDQADPSVKAYPRFRSQQPIYGRVSFADPLDGPDRRTTYHLALDESGGTGQGYDRLYFDLNQDGDLTNDQVLAVQRNPPQGATLDYSPPAPQVCFEKLGIPLPFGAEGRRPLEMMPRLVVGEKGYKGLDFVTTKARRGRIRIGGGKYNVLLGHNGPSTGWFERPGTALHLFPADTESPPMWIGGDQLAAMHRIDGTLYQFSATPAGDRLTVRPYEGPWGVFEVGAGGRTVDVVEVAGSLRSRNTIVAVGEDLKGYRLSPAHTSVRACTLPVGDYTPEALTVRLGQLQIHISNNPRADSKQMDPGGRQPVYGIEVREDKPFVLDFSNHPAVTFASPAENQQVRPGEDLKILAALVDPVLDIMIRHLSDTSRTKSETFKTDDGQEHTVTLPWVLNPTVVVSRANGEIVAEGVMPSG